MFWYDNRCSDKALRFWQFASVVVDDVEESHTVNFVSAVLQRNIDGTGPGDVEVLAVVEKKAHRARVWKMLGKDQFIQGMLGVFLS